MWAPAVPQLMLTTIAIPFSAPHARQHTEHILCHYSSKLLQGWRVVAWPVSPLCWKFSSLADDTMQIRYIYRQYIYIFKLYFFILSWPGSHIYCWVCRKLQMYTHLSTKRGSFLAFLIGPHINIQYILGWRLEEQHQYNRCVTATSPDYFHILLFIAPLWCSAPLSTDMECKGNGITTL